MWPGKTKRSGDWGKEEHIRVQLNIERQQFSQPTKEMTNARPRGLRIWYRSVLPDYGTWPRLRYDSGRLRIPEKMTDGFGSSEEPKKMNGFGPRTGSRRR